MAMAQQSTWLTGEDRDAARSRGAFDAYIRTRWLVSARSKLDGEKLAEIRSNTRAWVADQGFAAVAPDYQAYSRERVSSTVLGLVDFLRARFPGVVSELELVATELFVEAAYSMYESSLSAREQAPDADGSFAFVVPPRMSRRTAEYAGEVEQLVPALRYVPNELWATLLTGLPPLVIDTYARQRDGRRGYLVFAPVYPDMLEDFADDPGRALTLARRKIDDAVAFSRRRLGVEVVGLGAVLPALTHFGSSIADDAVTVTTGHGGTVHLIKRTVRRAIAEGYVGQTGRRPRIGVIGLGSLGLSAAEILAEEFDTELAIYDRQPERIRRAARRLPGLDGRLLPASSIREVFEESDIVVGAVTSPISLTAEGVHDLDGCFIVDDSQPGAFDADEVQRLGGHLAWVIGRSKRLRGACVRSGYDYASMVDPQLDVFGCEAEAASLAMAASDLRRAGLGAADVRARLRELAVREPVTAAAARRIGGLFERYDIGSAPLQAFGRPLR
jgi:predicted amino acid dehydrogenase